MRAYMGLTCKIGCYNKIITALTSMDIPMGNIFLLYGPIDVLVRFDGFDYLKEFISKYFNPIRMIGGKERLLSKTTTYVAVIESPSFWEQPFAFMFLNVQPQDAEIAQKKLLTLPNVIAADYVFGPCDLIVAVRAKDSIDLEKVVHSVHCEVSGIEEAHTTIVAMAQI